MKQPAVYIVASGRKGTLYTGVTSDLPKRIHQHREATISGFSARHGCRRLVWHEVHDEMLEAIRRETLIKSGSHRKKLALIEPANPQWRDLFEELF